MTVFISMIEVLLEKIVQRTRVQKYTHIYRQKAIHKRELFIRKRKGSINKRERSIRKRKAPIHKRENLPVYE